MHIHPGSLNLGSASLYSAAGAEKAAAEQKAAETRRKLAGAAAGIAGSASPGSVLPDETVLIGQWMDGRHSQVLSGDEYRSAASGKDSGLG